MNARLNREARVKNKKAALYPQTDATDVIVLKKGSANTNWWEEKELKKLLKDPTPWGHDSVVPVEEQKGIIRVRITRQMLEEYNAATNSQGRNILKSFGRYAELGPLAIAGIRHTSNISNIHDTRQVKNSFERLLTALSLGLMVKIIYNKGAGFPYQANYGHEVRYHSSKFQDILVRNLAALGFICHVFPHSRATAIWNSSTMGKFFNFVLSFCGTASHAESNVDGLKIMDYEGSQFLTSAIEAMIDIQKAIIEKIKRDGYVDFYLSAADDSRITDHLYASTHNGMYVYRKYQEQTALDEEILGLVRGLDSKKIHIDCAHGSGYRTLTEFLKEIDLKELLKGVDWMHIDERPDFGNIGKLKENPKTGKDEIFDLGADGTQLYERVMPSGKVIKYFPVLCTADYPKRFAAMTIGDIILYTDMDNDRLYVSQILPNDENTKKLLDEIGVVYNIVNKDKINAVFIPNKFFHFLHEMNFERLAKLMQKGKINKDRTLVVLKTLASTPAIDKWAEKRKEEGFDVEVINTSVGFSKLANVMYRTEGRLREHPREDVIITDASGKDINIGKDPIVIAAWEESGGIIIGITYGFKDLLGKSFLAEREKSATESILLSLALLSKLQKKNEKVDLARYLKELYERDEVDTPIDIRFDNKLYVPDTSEKAALEENEGQGRKNRIFGAYLAIAISYIKRKLTLEEIKPILKDLFIQEYEARKVHEKFKLDDVLLERFKQICINSLVDIKFTGDGVMFIFDKKGKKWFVLLRPSGTEPKLKSYGFGSDTERLTIDTWVFAFNENVAGILPESFTSIPALMNIWGSDGTKAVEKSRRMQTAWEDFGLVVDPTDGEDLQRLGLDLKALEKRRLVRSFNPPDDHLERINRWLKGEGLKPIEIDLTQPQAMPQEAIVDLLQAIPEEVYKKLGRTKQEVLVKERADGCTQKVKFTARTVRKMQKPLKKNAKSR